MKNFVENLRKSLEKDKEMMDSLKAFESEKSRVVKSDSVKLFKQRASNAKVWDVNYMCSTCWHS